MTADTIERVTMFYLNYAHTLAQHTMHTHAYLVLPGDGDAAGAELAVEGVVAGVQADALHCGELLNVKDVLAVHRSRLHTHRRHVVTNALLK